MTFCKKQDLEHFRSYVATFEHDAFLARLDKYIADYEDARAFVGKDMGSVVEVMCVDVNKVRNNLAYGDPLYVNHKILAIKLVRMAGNSHMGLKEAKDLVDSAINRPGSVHVFKWGHEFDESRWTRFMNDMANIGFEVR